MPGLSLTARISLIDELRHRVLEMPRSPRGDLALLVTPADLKVLTVLALDFHNGASGRCDPGYRAIARRTGLALGTISKATRRLRVAGWLSWKLVLRYIHGSMRFCRAYELAEVPPGLRSRQPAKPVAMKAGPQPPKRYSGLNLPAREAAMAALARVREARMVAMVSRGLPTVTRGTHFRLPPATPSHIFRGAG